MITELRAQKFKSWLDTGPMRLAPITGLFGTNSSGKTSILQLLLMLKQTVDSSERVFEYSSGLGQATKHHTNGGEVDRGFAGRG